MPFRWYAFHSQPHKEDLLWQQLQARGFEGFYPRIRVQPVNPRSRKVRPYFPGYLFVLADLEASGISAFQWMPYGTGLVSFGGEPAMVPESLIAAIRQRVQEIDSGGGELLANLTPGDSVIIRGGPFAGYEAIFDARISGTERVKVLLQMLSTRQLPVELEAGQIEKKSAKIPHANHQDSK